MRNLRPRFESTNWDPLKPFAPEKEIEKLHAASFGWALTCCRFDRQEAADVLQAAYLKVLDGRAKYDGQSAVRTWLFSVIRKTAADRHRRRFLEALALRRWWVGRAPAVESGADELVAREERRKCILGALQRLATRQRQVLDLVFYHGMTIEEAAKVMGVSIGTARAHYHRGKRRLALELSGATDP
jgi:RNA polymerase sigma-70 factor (ECF subfamily)